VSLRTSLFWLGYLTSAAYLFAGIAGGIWPGHWDDTGAADQILWVVLLVGGALLLLAGLRLIERSPWPGAALVSIGAVAGALVIFWTFVVLIAAVALVVLAVVYARRLSRAPSAARTRA
jgi:hypothetical protein